jgi:hypothetical protein
MASRLELSPELVLVSPDLAEIARAALPDRPWEAFIPRDGDTSVVSLGDRPSAVVEVALRRSAGLRELPSVPRSLGDSPVFPLADRPSAVVEVALRRSAGHRKRFSVPPPLADPPVPSVGHVRRQPRATESPRGWRPWRAVALTMIGLAILVALSSRRSPDEPTFAAERPTPTTPQSPARPEPSPANESSEGLQSPTAPSSIKEGADMAKASAAGKSTVGAAAPPPPATGRGGAVPGGGYVFGSDGRLVVANDGTSITRFEATTSCGVTVTFRQIVLTRAGTFSAQRTLKQRGKLTVVKVSGHVAAPGLIRGNLSAVAPGCAMPVRRYSARLS